MTGFKSHYITANGIRIHYLREGRGPALQVSLAPEAGHFVHYEQPALACREIEAFFRRV